MMSDQPIQVHWQGVFLEGTSRKSYWRGRLIVFPAVLVVGQPTRGVDIGAIEFIHQRILDLRDNGTAILLVSVELDEILSLSDRVAVLFDGRIIGERVTAETNERELGLLMAGIIGDSLETEGQSAVAKS